MICQFVKHSIDLHTFREFECDDENIEQRGEFNAGAEEHRCNILSALIKQQKKKHLRRKI